MIRLFTYKHMNDVICFVVLNKLDDSPCGAAGMYGQKINIDDYVE